MMIVIPALFAIVFFIQPITQAEFSNHLVTLETILLPVAASTQSPVETTTPPPAAFHTNTQEKTPQPGMKKTPTTEWASPALLNPITAPLAAKIDENEEGFSGYLDTLPSVQGIAFFEGMAPATQSLSERSEIYTYTVEENDTPAGIADLFGISLDTLLWANNLRAQNVIRPGDTLVILPVNGIAHSVAKDDSVGGLAKKYNIPAEDIIAYNNLSPDGALTPGATLVIPHAIKVAPAPSVVPVQKRSAPRPVEVTREVVNAPAGWLDQPAAGHNWGRRHGFNGIDIANSCGTPIRAAAQGMVIVADDVGWNGGYGKYIKVQHPNGVITLYAHAKELLVDVGMEVAQDQQIAVMGTTGRSTGCHVHFEVRGAKNPFVRR